MQKKLNTYPAADTDLNAWSKYQKYPTRLLVEGEIQRLCDFDQSLIVPILQLRDRYSQSMWPKVTLSNSCIVLTIASSSILQTIGAVVTRTRAIFHVGKSAACDRNWPLWGRDFGCRPDWKKQTKAGFARLEVFESCKWLLSSVGEIWPSNHPVRCHLANLSDQIWFHLALTLRLSPLPPKTAMREWESLHCKLYRLRFTIKWWDIRLAGAAIVLLFWFALNRDKVFGLHSIEIDVIQASWGRISVEAAKSWHQ